MSFIRYVILLRHSPLYCPRYKVVTLVPYFIHCGHASTFYDYYRLCWCSHRCETRTGSPEWWVMTDTSEAFMLKTFPPRELCIIFFKNIILSMLITLAIAFSWSVYSRRTEREIQQIRGEAVVLTTFLCLFLWQYHKLMISKNLRTAISMQKIYIPLSFHSRCWNRPIHSLQLLQPINRTASASCMVRRYIQAALSCHL